MYDKTCPMKRHESYGHVEFGSCEYGKCGFWNGYLKECGIAALGAIGFAIMRLKGDENNGVQYSKD